jgi:hypothetical protein
MFIRFRQVRDRLQVPLVETSTIAGQRTGARLGPQADDPQYQHEIAKF